jgi:hypothetical protein
MRRVELSKKAYRIGQMKAFGGPVGLALILVVQLSLVLLAWFDWRLSAAAIVGFLALVMALRSPVFAIGLLVGGRILSTGSMSFIRVNGMNIGLFEPMVLLALLVAVHHAMHHKLSLATGFPWRTPLLIFLLWQCVGLLWAYKATSGVQEIVAVGIILATTSLILAFVRDWSRFRTVMLAWVGASVLVGILSMATSFTQVAATGQTWEIAAQGGRETGLGQQPNWFAMNLMFGVLTAFALALSTQKTSTRFWLTLAGLFIFFAQLRSGSRGGAYAIVIGGCLMALANPVFRKWMLRLGVLLVLLFAYQVSFGDNVATRKAFMRIWMNLDILWQSDIRARNWLACIHMFQETHGLGIGAGGYAQVIADYDWRIYDSIHRYPHGIPWGILAHYGVVGMGCATWLVVRVGKMARKLIGQTRGTDVEPLAWAMPATMFAYFAWSFVEFSFDDKPFWEFLALFTALYLWVQRCIETGEALPGQNPGLKPFTGKPKPARSS